MIGGYGPGAKDGWRESDPANVVQQDGCMFLWSRLAPRVTL
jgi:hypothetical protein